MNSKSGTIDTRKDGTLISRVGEVVSHWAHNPKNGSANLSPATKEN